MKKETITTFMIGLMIAAIFIVSFNAYQLQQLQVGLQSKSTAQNPTQQQNTQLQGMESILPKGVPAIYGAELGISFDDVTPDNAAKADETIGKLGKLDVDIKLDDAQKARYITALYTMENGISCEYCCGARAIIFENGDPACGCAHSYAMRGLTKYLIVNHGSEYTDAQLLEEAGKWKTLFFPDVMQQKAAVLKANGVELNYINLASNKYRGAEKGTASGGGNMVGGC